MPDLKQAHIQLALLVAGLAGVVAVFLPFTSDVSPWDKIYGRPRNDFRQFGLPFVLALPITIASVRVLASNSMSRVERTLAYIMGVSAVIVVLPWFWEDIVVDGLNELLFPIYGLALVTGVSCFIAGLRKDWFGQHIRSPRVHVPPSLTATCQR